MSAWLAVSIVFGFGVIVGWAAACLTAGWYRLREQRRQGGR